MYYIFLTTLTNEIIGLLPITIVQASFIASNSAVTVSQHVAIQAVVALAFGIGNFALYFLGKYGSVPLLKFFGKYKTFSKDTIKVSAKFHYIVLMRAIPFFPAKHVSIGLGVLRYNMLLFFLSSCIGIFIRGIILIGLYKLGYASIHVIL